MLILTLLIYIMLCQYAKFSFLFLQCQYVPYCQCFPYDSCAFDIWHLHPLFLICSHNPPWTVVNSKGWAYIPFLPLVSNNPQSTAVPWCHCHTRSDENGCVSVSMSKDNEMMHLKGNVTDRKPIRKWFQKKRMSKRWCRICAAYFVL